MQYDSTATLMLLISMLATGIMGWTIGTFFGSAWAGVIIGATIIIWVAPVWWLARKLFGEWTLKMLEKWWHFWGWGE